jgi:hypothetical protein
MFTKNELIVNSSYKDFFVTPETMRRDSFILPKIADLSSLENSQLTRSLALYLQNIDIGNGLIYGIEIKSNGSERSSRIPLVRFSDKSVSIWKVASGIESIEKAVITLNDLYYFLKEHSNNSYKLPKKIIVLKCDESLFINNNSEYKNYIDKTILKNDLTIISFAFLKAFIEEYKSIDLDTIISNEEKKIFTTLDL